MRERKYVKFRVDMYDDTKFKIIDRKPERDLIHYIWSRLVVLAGKINLDGDLYFSKNLPHTIETLSTEFNRGTHEVKSAIYVLLELQMLELTEDKVYRVKNFAKHQNIKPKQKIDTPVDQPKVVEEVKNPSILNPEVENKEIPLIDNNIITEVPKDPPLNAVPIIFETKKTKKQRRNSKIDTSINDVGDELEENAFFEGDSTLALGKDAKIVNTWVF